MRFLGARSKASRIVIAIGVAAGAVLLAGIFLLRYKFPFAESSVRKQLASAASATVEFGSFHQRYFPPGCVAENVTFARRGAKQPLLTIGRLEIASSFGALLHHHVSTMHIENAQVNWKEWKTRGQDPPSRHTVIDHLIATNTLIDVEQGEGKQPLGFYVRNLQVNNLRGLGQSSFFGEVENPLPRGLLRVSGRFGPMTSDPAKLVPISGTYDLNQADLSVFNGIAGKVSSSGTFSGTVEQITVQGRTNSPAFEVTKTGHAQPLSTSFTALVNTTTGDVVLPQVAAMFGKDQLQLQGTIASGKDKKRAADLEIYCPRGRIEDTLYPFIHSAKAPLTGDATFRMRVRIPSGHEKFLKKLYLQSSFRITDARFTNPKTQVHLSKVAEAPEQKNPNPAVPAQFEGRVTLQDGTARFSSLSLRDKDASAWLTGTYALSGEEVNLHGKLKTAASLTKTTHGVKSAIAKLMEPLFKKKPHDTVVPVKIGGTYKHPTFGLDLGQKQKM